MGKKNGNNKKSEKTVTKFMDGRMTPNEVHRALAFRGRKCLCGAPAAMRLKTLVQLDELTKRQPEFVAQIMATNPNGTYVPTIPTKYGPMVMVGDAFACDNCKVDAERAAARGPSWAIIEIDRGPGPVRPMVQVPGN